MYNPLSEIWSNKNKTYLFFLIAFVDLSSFLLFVVSSRILFMGNRHHISREIKEAALKMTQEGLSDPQVEQFLGISGWAMRRLRQTYQETGEAVWIPACPGRSRILDGLDAQVRPLLFISRLYYWLLSQFLEGCILRQPDMTLDELQVHLLEVTEIQVSPATIWRTLRRLGYTMKTVSLLLSSPST